MANSTPLESFLSRPDVASISMTSPTLPGDNDGATYTRFIKNSYRHHPDAISYYEQLVDYIAPSLTSRKSLLQGVKVFEVQDNLDSDGALAIPHFPFRVVDGEQPSSGPRVNILEGFPSPECIAYLGARMSLRPEFFLGHLNLSHIQPQRPQFYELPTLPSRQDNIIHVRLVTLVRSLKEPSLVTSFSDSRKKAMDSCQASEKLLFREKRYGSARYRKFHIHNSQYHSFEQMVSFCISQTEPDSWDGVFLLDSGRSLIDNHRLPWSSYTQAGKPAGSLPVVPYNGVVDSSERNMSPETVQDSTPAVLDRFHPLKDMLLHDADELELLWTDPFFLLSKLLIAAALSWSQLVNFLSEDVRQCRAAGPARSALALEQLNYDAELLDQIQGHLRDNIYIIQRGGCPSWPKASKSSLVRRKEAIIKMLEVDHDALSSLCRQLSKQCEVASSILVSSAQLAESQKGIAQARQVHSLTRLAFFFIPMTFVASVFSMSVAELQRHPSIWVYFTIAMPISCAAWIAAGWRDLFDANGKFSIRALFTGSA
ncbi:MAG: hypothetical protein M1817_004547 [Caeruleum heppii]|nr:MAG: hypothetical protein M1817_004547 [Caeruleum heppii]